VLIKTNNSFMTFWTERGMCEVLLANGRHMAKFSRAKREWVDKTQDYRPAHA